MNWIRFSIITIFVFTMLCSCNDEEYLQSGTRGPRVVYSSGIIYAIHDAEGNNLLDKECGKYISEKNIVMVNSYPVYLDKSEEPQIYNMRYSLNTDDCVNIFGDKYIIDSITEKAFPKDSYIIGGIDIENKASMKVSFYWADKSIDHLEFTLIRKLTSLNSDTLYFQEDSVGPFYHNFKEIKVVKLPYRYSPYYYVDIIK